MSKVRIFLSYARTDQRWTEEFSKHLRVLEALEVLDVWSDRLISAGDPWEVKIFEALALAHVAVLFVSPDFLASEFIRKKELPRIQERHQSGMLQVVPVLVRPSLWKRVDWLKDLQMRPADGSPLAALEGYRLDATLVTVANEIIEREYCKLPG